MWLLGKRYLPATCSLFENCELWCFQGVVIWPDEDQAPAAMRGDFPKDGMLD
jgi:hypothetical protein